MPLGQLALLRQLISVAPEAVRVADVRGRLLLHDGSDEAIVLLLEAAPDTATALDDFGMQPLPCIKQCRVVKTGQFVQ